MDEGHERSVCALPRDLVDQANASLLQACQGGADVGDAQREMVDARATLRDVFRDGRIVRGALEEFNRRLPHGNEVRTHALRGDFLGRLDLQPECVAIELQGGADIADRDADVIDRQASRGRRSRRDREP